MPAGSTSEKGDELKRRKTGKNTTDNSLSYFHTFSDTFLCTSVLSPNDISMKNALELLRSMELMLERDAKEGQYVL